MNRLITLIRQPFITINYYSKHRDNNVWVFGEWIGAKANDNSLYFANYVCQTNDNIKCYWVANKNTDLHLLNKKITVLERDSKHSKKIFKKCGVVIMNQNFLDFSSSGNNYFNGALTINLWHEPFSIKKIIFDTLKFKTLLTPVLYIYKLLLMPKYYLSTSEERDKILNSAFFANNKLIKAGQPRSIVLHDNSLALKNELLNNIQLPLNTKIISYLPTFRTKNNNTFLFDNEKELINVLNKNNAIIIQKRHFADKSPNNTIKSRYIFNIANLSAQEMLQISDILITDYSSCCFDFLIKNRPIIHYLYDYRDYISKERELYYNIEDICCGDICYTYNDLLKYINSSLNNINNGLSLRNKRKNKFMERDEMNNCQNIYNQIIDLINTK